MRVNWSAIDVGYTKSWSGNSKRRKWHILHWVFKNWFRGRQSRVVILSLNYATISPLIIARDSGIGRYWTCDTIQNSSVEILFFSSVTVMERKITKKKKSEKNGFIFFENSIIIGKIFLSIHFIIIKMINSETNKQLREWHKKRGKIGRKTLRKKQLHPNRILHSNKSTFFKQYFFFSPVLFLSFFFSRLPISD